MSLAARELSAAYPGGPEVLHGVSLEVRRGRFACLLGPNGSGKSSLLRGLAGLLPPRRGAVELDGAAVQALSPARRARRIGFLPQDLHPAFPFTAQEAVALGARVAGHGRWFETRLSAEAAAAVSAALRAVEAEALAGRPLGDLSGGERRRVLIASVLAQEPEYLLLDEPAAMLDLHHQAALFRTLQRLAAAGLGVLCVTHDFNLAAAFADELILLDGGRLSARGRPGEVLNAAHLQPLFGGFFELVARPGAPPVVLPR